MSRGKEVAPKVSHALRTCGLETPSHQARGAHSSPHQSPADAFSYPARIGRHRSKSIKAAVKLTRVTSLQFWSGKPPPGPGSRCSSSPSSCLAPGRKEDSWLHLKSKYDTHQFSTDFSTSSLSYTSLNLPQDPQHSHQLHTCLNGGVTSQGSMCLHLTHSLTLHMIWFSYESQRSSRAVFVTQASTSRAN